MNTTYGHQTDTVLWTSDNGVWTIEQREVYARSGELKRRYWTIYDTKTGVMWPINAKTAENDYYPKYVRKAIAHHVTEL